MIAQAQRAAEVASVRGESAQRGRHVSDGEIRALLEACMVHDTEGGTRDAALIAVAFATGMRRAELCALALGDVALIDEGYELTIRRAKGGKTRVVAVYNGARDYLRDWLTLRGDDPGPLFLAVRKDGVILDHGISPAALQAMLGKRALVAGVTNVHWHDARRTMAGELLDRGADLSTVQKLLGHSSPVTTSSYERRGDEVRNRALQGLHVPYLR
jgi:integrase